VVDGLPLQGKLLHRRLRASTGAVLLLTDFHNSLTAEAAVNTFSSAKKMESSANWENLFRSSLQAVQFASVSSCSRRLLKHFSCRSFRMMGTTDHLGMSVFRDILRTVSSGLVLLTQNRIVYGFCRTFHSLSSSERRYVETWPIRPTAS